MQKKLDNLYSFINYNDSIIMHNRIYYKASCPVCNSDRGYKRPNKFNSHCASCQTIKMRSSITDLSRKKQSTAMLGKIPINKKRSPEHVKLRHCVSSLVYSRLKKRSATKGKSFFESIGYSFEQLIFHLESKFQLGMSWANYGIWHIDHIKPDSLFSYKKMDDSDFKLSWALNNLQPLWAKDNLNKGAKYGDMG